MISLNAGLLLAAVNTWFLVPLSLQGLPPPIPDDLVAEGYLFTDLKSLERYRREESNSADAQASLRKDIDLYIAEANRFLESLKQYGLKIQIRIVGLKMLDKDLVSNYQQTGYGQVVEGKVILTAFGRYLQNDANLKDDYDFAFLFTGYELPDRIQDKMVEYGYDSKLSRETMTIEEGEAKLGSICDGYQSRGVVESHGTFATAGTVARVLAILLGAEYDQFNAPYFMTPEITYMPDPRTFQFSNLSADYILKNFRGNSRQMDCLKQTNPKSWVPTVTPQDYSGKMQDINNLCARALGPGSTPCTSSGFYYNKMYIAGDDLCYTVTCRRPNYPTSCTGFILTPEGMPCGMYKACHRGKCRPAKGAKYSNVNPQCIFGDDKNPMGSGKVCSEWLIGVRMRYCDYPRAFSRCCESCLNYATGLAGCPFGDRSKIDIGNSTLSCYEAIALNGKKQICDQFEDSCCLSCQIPAHSKDCPNGDTPEIDVDGRRSSCGKAVSDLGMDRICRHRNLNKLCCVTCHLFRGRQIPGKTTVAQPVPRKATPGQKVPALPAPGESAQGKRFPREKDPDSSRDSGASRLWIIILCACLTVSSGLAVMLYCLLPKLCPKVKDVLAEVA